MPFSCDGKMNNQLSQIQQNVSVKCMCYWMWLCADNGADIKSDDFKDT